MVDCSGQKPQRAKNHEIIVSVLCAQCVLVMSARLYIGQAFAKLFWEKDGSDTAARLFGAFQNLNRGTKELSEGNE